MTIELKVLGMINGTFMCFARSVELEAGAKVKTALAAAFKQGILDKATYKTIKGLRPPFFAVINDEKVSGKAGGVQLNDGDILSVMQAMSGG